MKTDTAKQESIKRTLQNRLSTHYGDDTEQVNRLLGLSGYELEQEAKRVFNITSNISYFTT